MRARDLPRISITRNAGFRSPPHPLRPITPSVSLAVALALAPLAIDLAAWRAVSAIFDRERLITGSRAQDGADGASAAARPGG